MVFGEVVDGGHILEAIDELTLEPGKNMLAKDVEVCGGRVVVGGEGKVKWAKQVGEKGYVGNAGGAK